MISLLIPFGSRDSRRCEIFFWVVRRWAHMFPEWQLCVGTDDENDFNRSRARNNAFKQAKGDILILTDADTACNEQQVLNAIGLVEKGVPWVIAHDKYYSLTREYTAQVLESNPRDELRPPFISDWVMNSRSQAGVLVIPRPAWERIHGYDERFISWGYEDNAFAVTMDRNWGHHQRVEGPMLHLWHPRGLDFNQPHIEHNRKLYEEACNEAA